MKTGKQLLLLLVVLITHTACFGPGPITVPSSPFWNSLAYVGKQGQVGKSMTVEVVADCAQDWSSTGFRIVSGEVPPGLIFDGQSFSGSPQVGGTWLLQVRVQEPACRGDVFPDKDIFVMITVDHGRFQRMR